MAREHVISKKCLCLYSVKPNRHCGSEVFLITKNLINSLNVKPTS